MECHVILQRYFMYVYMHVSHYIFKKWLVQSAIPVASIRLLHQEAALALLKAAEAASDGR